jgi:hypothetical protein
MQIQSPTHRIHPVARARRGALVAATGLACAALMSACGSSSTSSTVTTKVNTARVAASIEESVLKERNLHVKVVCPTTVPQEVGKTFECTATGHSTKKPFTETKTPFVVTIQNSKGYVTYVGK